MYFILNKPAGLIVSTDRNTTLNLFIALFYLTLKDIYNIHLFYLNNKKKCNSVDEYIDQPCIKHMNHRVFGVKTLFLHRILDPHSCFKF